ncbi:MAG: class I SAM-dependent methyltransferase [Chloracidobacterium sp.]|uniref:Class I SAM-dependent methyltransferase n=1 Tax=Chloracidobacterium validum TaxID=2821543 RepID=A0ABX8B7T4_9BACT|nr:class I SAM-dependent methyltransferase [Chloracidobacterium validum]QUW03007.1 class I SAM-dependent methyltransferase [Chloracidobacterium validum]
MKPLDYHLQNWRIAVVRPHLSATDRILDIGAFDGALARQVREFRAYVGIDPEADPAQSTARMHFVRGRFPQDLPPSEEPFDAVTLLALLEHIPDTELGAFARACADALRPGGKLLITVPHPFVDRILDILMALRLLDGMETDAHHGFDVARTRDIFEQAGFELTLHRRFQLGLNNFFAFRKI